VHQIKFSLGTIEVPMELIGQNPFEISEWLEKTDLQTQVVCNAPNFCGRSLVKKQVVLKNFYGIEMGGSDSLDFFLETSTE